MGGRRASSMGVLSAALVLALALGAAPGCSPSAPEVKPDKPAAEEQVLGPYPMNVTVRLGRISLTLTSVQVLARDDSAGPFIRKLGPFTPAPEGYRYVDATIEVLDPSLTEATAQDTATLFGEPMVVADETTVSVGARATGFGGDDYSTYHETMEFTVPEHATEAVLHIPMASENSATVTFRLW